MRILVVGAGAVGGYFGGRLLEAGRDVAFLVRPRRAAALERDGLRIRSRFGDVDIPSPPMVQSGDLREPFDLVILSAKAYDLDGAIDDLAPAAGPETAVLPLLNGMRHLDVLDERLGRERVLGGTCAIASHVNEAGEVVHLNDIHTLTFGERHGSRPARAEAIARVMEGARFDWRASDAILLDMWEKWVFLATLAGATCLMRAAVGDIIGAPGGAEFVGGLLEECRAIATARRFPPRPESWSRMAAMVTAPGSAMTASMLRDIERGSAIEGDHIIGDLLRRADGIPTPYLRIAYTGLKAYDARRARG